MHHSLRHGCGKRRTGRSVGRASVNVGLGRRPCSSLSSPDCATRPVTGAASAHTVVGTTGGVDGAVVLFGGAGLTRGRF